MTEQSLHSPEEPTESRSGFFSIFLGFFKSLFQSIWRFLLLISVLVFAVWIYWKDQIFYPSTYDAHMFIPTLSIATQINGRINTINVKPGSFVKKGQLLFTLNDTSEALAVATAEAELEKSKKQYQSAYDAISISRNRVTQAKNNLQLAEHNYQRYKKLFDQGIGSAVVIEKLKLTYDNALQALSSAQSAFSQAQLSSGSTEIRIMENKLAKAKLELNYTKVYAPVTGFVTFFHLTKSQYVHAGETLFGQLDGRHMYVQANILEMFLQRIRVNQLVTFTLRMYPDKHYQGIVSAVGYAIASGGNTLGKVPTIQPAFDWVHIARRFPIYIEVTSPHYFKTHPFRSGASAWVKINTTR